MNVLESFALNGRVALVTGGESKLGKQIVLALAQAGAKVYMASRSIDALEMAAQRYQADGYNVCAAYLDQGDVKSILNLKDKLYAKERKIDILVNNAALRTMRNWNDSADAFAESMKVNATGFFILIRAFADEMAKSGGGSIINLGSTMGMKAMSRRPDGEAVNFIPDYSFHKGGIINLTKLVASYYGLSNVRCNCISPGAFRHESTPEDYAQIAGKSTMLGRMVGPTDLMGAIVFLASDASSFITGVNLPVDGGATAR
jgi:NAD(P)-dependent dehydrogenase (short-subunit alcohol dehydrogenase family)